MRAGVDEVGRGPLAGPVVAAAVILGPDHNIEGLIDSKKLTAIKREKLSELIWENALAVSIAEASVEEIDDINILQASLLAMKRAVLGLSVNPSEILIDGSHIFKCDFDYKANISAIVKGDQLIEEISAASTIAKVYRDRMMSDLAEKYPNYGFERHMGYPTKMHLEALNKYGIVDKIHRESFAPVKRIIKKAIIS